MFENGQRLEPPLVLFPGPELEPSPIHTADPLRRPGQATYIDPVEDLVQDDLHTLSDPNAHFGERDR